MNIKYATKEDLNYINEYFEDTGIVYDKTDQIVVCDTVYEVAFYLYHDRFEEMLNDMQKRKPIDRHEDLLTNFVDELNEVFQSPDDGTYFVIKQQKEEE